MKTPEELAAEEVAKKADHIAKAQAAHEAMGKCLSGECDHKGIGKCMEKMAGEHEKLGKSLEKLAAAKEKDDEDETEEEKAAKAAEIKKAADKAELVKRAKELGLTIAESAAAAVADPKVAELEKTVKELKEQVEKGAPVERRKPVLAGKTVTKADDVDANDPDVKKFSAIDKKDPAVVAKSISAIRSAEPELVD